MNFEFKSTFKQTINHFRRISHALWILIANTTSSGLVISLYLTDVFLPATLGSRPHGNHYILLIEVAIAIKILSSVYATVFLIHRYSGKSLQYITILLADTTTLLTWIIPKELSRLRRAYTPLNIQRIITKIK
jgi:hypothetical protein